MTVHKYDLEVLLTTIKKAPHLIGALVGLLVVASHYYWLGIPRFFYGDDYLLFQASRTENGYASSILGSLNDVGSGKWRPLFTFLVSIMLKMFGNNYFAFFLINLLLLGVIATLCGKILTEHSKLNSLQIGLISSSIPISRFAWYGRISPYGIMELGAIICSLIFIIFFFRAQRNGSTVSWYLSGLMALCATMFHERYLVLLGSSLLVALYCSIKKKSRIPIDPWLVYTTIYLFLKVNVLKLDIWQGGGEVPLRSSKGAWILEHFLVALKAVVGLSDGRVIQFDVTGYVRESSLSIVALFYPVAIVLFAVLIRERFSLTTARTEGNLEEHKFQSSIFLVATVGIILLIPASTVVSRIEGRWLFGSEILLTLFLLLLADISHPNGRHVVSILISGICLLNVISLRTLSKYENPVRSTNRIIEFAQRENKSHPDRYLFINDPENRTTQIQWQLAYGGVFSQFENSLRGVIFYDSNCTERCIKLNLKSVKTIEIEN
jgi:hypothetical protein